MDSRNGRLAPEGSKALVAQTQVQKPSKHSKNVFRSTRMPAGLDYEELGGLSDPGQQDCPWAGNVLE